MPKIKILFPDLYLHSEHKTADMLGILSGYGAQDMLAAKRVNFEINTENGYNKFTDDSSGKHFVVYKLNDDNDYYNRMMDTLLIQKAQLK